jgi:hypothetical protein
MEEDLMYQLQIRITILMDITMCENTNFAKQSSQFGDIIPQRAGFIQFSIQPVTAFYISENNVKTSLKLQGTNIV